MTTAPTTVLRELLGDVLRERRRDQGLTLRDVSERARISLGYISEVERGQKEASSELLAALAQALDVPLSQVILDVGALMQTEEAAELATVSSIAPGEVRASAA